MELVKKRGRTRRILQDAAAGAVAAAVWGMLVDWDRDTGVVDWHDFLGRVIFMAFSMVFLDWLWRRVASRIRKRSG